MISSNVYMFPSYNRMMQVHNERRAKAGDAVSDYLIIEAGAITDGNKPSAQIHDIAEEAAKRSKG